MSFERVLMVVVMAVVVMMVMGSTTASALPLDDPVEAVKGVVSRVLPQYLDDFRFAVIPPWNGQDIFIVETMNTEEGDVVVSVQGNNGVSLASGAYYYVAHACNVSVSWSGDQTAKPSPLPPLPHPIQVVRQYKWSYYMNVCTVSYSMVWWDWYRWEREIDWMALSGLNLALAFTGQEKTWLETFKRFNVTLEELQDWFSGPAFLAWQRMGNMQKWGGPLSLDWIDKQYVLQLQILQRMRSLGITPVLTGFSGHVPPVIPKLFPNTTFTLSPEWGGFPDKYRVDLLDPTDPLFLEIGRTFLEVQESYYGTDHIYNTDTFNELDPWTEDPVYLRNASRAVLDSMLGHDPDAVWLMQGWLFESSWWTPSLIEAYLSGVPDDRMIILDLMAEAQPIWNTKGLFGKPFVWCMLHNFGGNQGLAGRFWKLLDPLQARQQGANIIGTGISMEGINTNPAVYTFMNEVTWLDSGVNTRDWILQYARRRYGKDLPCITYAWNLLFDLVYNNTQVEECWGMVRTPLQYRPWFRTSPSFCDQAFYNTTRMLDAWQSLVDCSTHITDLDPFNFDLVDVGREVLANRFVDVLYQFSVGYEASDIDDVQSQGALLLQILRDMDELLTSDPNFLLGRWIADARTWGSTDADKDLLEFNARNQLTLWGLVSGDLHDYAAKQWGGLVGSYYYGRWSMLVFAAIEAISTGSKVDRETFEAQCSAFEALWNNATEPTFPARPRGSPSEISQRLLATYGPQSAPIQPLTPAHRPSHGDSMPRWAVALVSVGGLLLLEGLVVGAVVAYRRRRQSPGHEAVLLPPDTQLEE